VGYRIGLDEKSTPPYKHLAYRRLPDRDSASEANLEHGFL
jgi:hypothetical protein